MYISIFQKGHFGIFNPFKALPAFILEWEGHSEICIGVLCRALF